LAWHDEPETPASTTIAVPTVVGGVSKLSTIPPIDTGKAATLNDISICPMAITIIGTQESLASSKSPADEPVRFAIILCFEGLCSVASFL
jgi:hypothetical protein